MKDAAAVCVGVLASVTWKVSKVPATSAAGIPLISPVAGFSVNPNGILPAVNFHMYGTVPPVAASVCEYPAPTTPMLSNAVVMVSGPVVDVAAMVRVKAAVALCAGVLESVTLNVSGEAVTTAVGVPLIAPVKAFNVKPAGSVPEVNCQV
jgi:hypothetical protein